MGRVIKKNNGLGGVVNAVGAVLAVLAVVSLVFMAYMGVFNFPKVAEKNVGPYTYVYESFKGDYAKTGPVFDKVYKSLLSDGVRITKGIGVYYDDPRKVAKDDLSSDCGAVIEEADLSKLPKILEKYTARTLAAKERPTVEFPYRNGLSFIIGPMKVYPILTKYVADKGYKIKAAIEIYDMAGGKIIYAMDVE